LTLYTLFYLDSVQSVLIQRLAERMLPTALPYMEEREGSTRHPARHERKPQKTVLVP